MTARFGLELTPSRCSLVSALPAEDDVRVLAFDTIAAGSADGGELKAALRPRLADRRYPDGVHAVLWGARSLCLTLPIEGDGDVQEQAFASAAAAAPDFRSWSRDAWIHLSVTRPGPDGRRAAFLVAASGRDLRKLLRHLGKVGLQVGQVSTPAMALVMLAQLRRGGEPGAVTAYLALNHDCGCVAIERGGRLLYATELNCASPSPGELEANPLLERYAYVARLAPQLRHAFEVVRRTHGSSVSHVITCGDLAELRSFTMPLIEELDLEVETLDSLAGIDVSRLPDPRDVFVEQMASLRLAWIAAAGEPSIELAPVARPQSLRRPALAWVIGGLGVAAAVLLGVAIWPRGSQVEPASGAPAGRAASAPSSAGAEAASAAEPFADTSAAGTEKAGDARPGESVGSDARASGETVSSVGRLPVPESASTSLRESDSAARTAGDPSAVQPARPPSGGAAGAEAAPVGPAPPAVETPAAAADRGVPTAPSSRDAAAPASPPKPAPTPEAAGEEAARAVARPGRPARDPVVTSILYSADSRLAVVDGRVVGVGDRVGDAIIADITPDEVVVRLPSGATRRWPMKSAGASGGRD